MKITRLLSALAVAALVFGCQPSQTAEKPGTETVVLKDGLYKASYDQADSRGWKAFLEIQVRDKMIVSGNFDYVNAEAAFKSQDQAYADAMKKVTNVTPADAGKALLDALIEKQSAAVDVVAGATGTSEAFKALAAAALAKAVQGDSNEALVPQPDVKKE